MLGNVGGVKRQESSDGVLASRRSVYGFGAFSADRKGAGRLIRGGGSHLASDRTDRGAVGSSGRRIVAMDERSTPGGQQGPCDHPASFASRSCIDDPEVLAGAARAAGPRPVGSMGPRMLEFMVACVLARMNIIERSVALTGCGEVYPVEEQLHELGRRVPRESVPFRVPVPPSLRCGVDER